MNDFVHSRNLFLEKLAVQDFELLRPHLRLREMVRGATLYRAGEIPNAIYFPHGGVVSSTVALRDGGVIDVRLTGREGALGASGRASGRISFTSAIVRLDGMCSTIEHSRFRDALERSPALAAAWDHHEVLQQAMTDQAIACNAMHNVEARLARRLIGLCRTFGSTRFSVTQEVLAEMLGIRRNAVSLVAQALQKAGIITYSRGNIEIVDLAGLQSHSCECDAHLSAFEQGSR
jgi:CRP-like cAMP-binding protein